MHKPLILLFVLFLSSGIFAQSIQLPKPNLKKRTLTVMQAYNAALAEARPDDFIFVGGSTFVVADLLEGLAEQR